MTLLVRCRGGADVYAGGAGTGVYGVVPDSVVWDRYGTPNMASSRLRLDSAIFYTILPTGPYKGRPEE